MEPTRFDALARRLAHGTSRRQLLKGLAVGLVGVAAAPLVTSATPGGNSTCAQFCAATFGADTPAAQQCTADAAKGTGLCYSCGPASLGGTKTLCCTTNTAGACTSYSGTTCPNQQTDLANCGACGNVCTTSVANATAICLSGQCGYACTTGYSTCNGACVNEQIDASNCGACGHVCASGESCVGGSCTCGSHGDCPTGQSCCGGTCVNEQTDAANCGGCGTVCTTSVANASATCTSGVCGFTCNSPFEALNGMCVPSSVLCAKAYAYDGTCNIYN